MINLKVIPMVGGDYRTNAEFLWHLSFIMSCKDKFILDRIARAKVWWFIFRGGMLTVKQLESCKSPPYLMFLVLITK